MLRSPFKGLDAFTRDDAARFFGRSREVVELYNRVQSGKLTLIYGMSGTGKSSLVRCGLANRFREHEWFPVYVRRGTDILWSTAEALYFAWREETEKQQQVETAAAAGAKEETNSRAGRRRLLRKAPERPPESFTTFAKDATLEELVERVYTALYRPIYLVFDQFEELYTINPFRKGEAYDAEARAAWEEEQRSFYRVIRNLLDNTRLHLRILLIVREEWWARMNEFEDYVPELGQNRMRIERMGDREMAEVIRETARFSRQESAFQPVHLGEADDESEAAATVAAILNVVRDQRDHSLDLVDLQLYLNRLLREFPREEAAVFTPELVATDRNQMDSVIDGFLSDSMMQIELGLVTRWKGKEPGAATLSLVRRAKGIPLEILFRLVTDQGTKQAVSEEELLEAPFFRQRGIGPEDIHFVLERLEDLKITHSYES